MLINCVLIKKKKSVIYSFGLLYTTLRIEQQQLIYLWKILSKESGHWTKEILAKTRTKGVGWGKMVEDLLARYI